MRSVRETILRVDFDATRRLARYPSTNVVSELVLAAVDELPAQRKARVKASSPPGEERVAG